MGFISKLASVGLVLAVGAVISEQSGLTEKFISEGKRNLMNSYEDSCKELVVMHKRANEIWVFLKDTNKNNNEDDKNMELLNAGYQLFLEDKIKSTNFLRKIFGDLDLFLKPARIMYLTDSINDYRKKYSNIFEKLSVEYSKIKKI